MGADYRSFSFAQDIVLCYNLRYNIQKREKALKLKRFVRNIVKRISDLLYFLSYFVCPYTFAVIMNLEAHNVKFNHASPVVFAIPTPLIAIFLFIGFFRERHRRYLFFSGLNNGEHKKDKTFGKQYISERGSVWFLGSLCLLIVWIWEYRAIYPYVLPLIFLMYLDILFLRLLKRLTSGTGDCIEGTTKWNEDGTYSYKKQEITPEIKTKEIKRPFVDKALELFIALMDGFGYKWLLKLNHLFHGLIAHGMTLLWIYLVWKNREEAFPQYIITVIAVSALIILTRWKTFKYRMLTEDDEGDIFKGYKMPTFRGLLKPTIFEVIFSAVFLLIVLALFEGYMIFANILIVLDLLTFAFKYFMVYLFNWYVIQKKI